MLMGHGLSLHITLCLSVNSADSDEIRLIHQFTGFSGQELVYVISAQYVSHFAVIFIFPVYYSHYINRNAPIMVKIP